MEFYDESSHINQIYVFFVNANSLKNILLLLLLLLLLLCEYLVVLCYKISVTLFIYHPLKVFIVLATWNGRLVLYILCVFVFNYCWLITTVLNLNGSNL